MTVATDAVLIELRNINRTLETQGEAIISMGQHLSIVGERLKRGNVDGGEKSGGGWQQMVVLLVTIFAMGAIGGSHVTNLGKRVDGMDKRMLSDDSREADEAYERGYEKAVVEGLQEVSHGH